MKKYWDKVIDFWKTRTRTSKIIIVVVGIFMFGVVVNALDNGPVTEASSTSITAPPTTSTSTTTSTTTTTVPVTTTVAPTTTAPRVTTPTTVRTTTPPTLGSTVITQLFIQVVRDYSDDLPFNWVDAYDDQLLVNWGHLACQGFDDGLEFTTIAFVWGGMLEEQGFDTTTDAAMVGYVIGAATVAFCPEHEGKLG